jgi:membrane-bound lytic murein transglycosylase F
MMLYKLYPIPLWRPCLALPFLLSLLLLLGGCEQPDRLQAIREAGVLHVITRNGPTTYYEDRHGAAGFEYELARQFADHLGVRLEIRTESSLEALFEAVQTRRADIAAAGLTITPERLERFQFAPPYLDIEQQVLVRTGRPAPLAAADLVGRNIHVLANSAHAATLEQLKVQHPELDWIESEDVETIDLLEELSEGRIDATLIDSNEYIANRAFYPQLRAAFRVGDSTQLAWALAGDPQNGALMEALERFFDKIRDNGQLAQLIERHYSHSEDNSPLDSFAFTQRAQTNLPKYLDAIQQTAEEFDMDWRLLAAISYQESHWNPGAESFTGVRGFMMLTQATARAMGVTNREDAVQSLRGGARYLKRIHQKLPARIKEPDRTWFALAAYNVGLGHLEDARVITLRQGQDPDKWAAVKEHLPLLSRRQWYSKTRHGYARGSEPVRFVQNIRHYYNVLTWSDLAKQRTPPRKITEQYLPDGFDLTLNAL